MGFFGRLFGGGGGEAKAHEDEAPAVLPESWKVKGPQHPWIIGAHATGGVIFEAGKNEIFLVVLPVADRAVFGEISKLAQMAKVMKVRAVVVCNAGNEGHLASSAIARACGLTRAYAIDATRPIDRGGDDAPSKPVDVRPFESVLATSLYIERRGTAVRGTWRNGATFLCGHPMSFVDLAASLPDHAVGKVRLDGIAEPGCVDVFLKLKQLIIPANVPGFEATRLANALARMGMGAAIVNGDVPGGDTDSGSAPAQSEVQDSESQDGDQASPAGEPRRMRVLAFMTMNQLDAADALAVEAIEAGDGVADMHHQRAMIALMRGDEASADAHLAKIGTPQSLTSRAIIAARRGDAVAMELAVRALEQLPGDVIAIRAAIMVHALAGERAKAREILAAQRTHLDAEIASALEHAIDHPPRQFGHNFPEHANLVFQAVKPMMDRGDYAQAEPLLRRAAQWDPENLEIVGDLGFALSKLERDADAVAVYDAAIARGGSRQLLRFNRGNCQLRQQHYDKAAEDFRACVEIKPDWHDARVNLVSALFAAGDRSSARQQIDQLKQLGGPPQFVTSLEKMMSGTL